MIKLIILALAIVTLSSCTRKAEESRTSGDFQVEKLFTHDGCTAYRFYDGRYVYYTTCGVTTSSTHSCGKSCTQSDEVTTY